MNRKALLITALAALALTSCKLVYEDQRPCEFKVKFVYDYNMKFADATSNELDNVTLYVFDESGALAYQGKADKQTLEANDNCMIVPLKTGKYNMVAWGNGKHEADAVVWNNGVGGIEAEMSRFIDTGSDNYLCSNIDALFYGKLEDSVPANADYTSVLHLMKNTNSVQVVLQQMTESAEVDPERYLIYTVADNSAYDAKNEFVSTGAPTIYEAWDVKGLLLTKSDYNGVKAEMTIPRLKPNSGMRLIVEDRRSDSQKPIIDIPLADILLLVRNHYSETLTEQEYLDRQDDFSIMFFLQNNGSGDLWLNTHIYVNSWKVVLQDTPLM
ncbi:MAG: FimB/Mfa2 family fimbrial subunit [Bacteroidales bacterium]|nr:FimB/Mfa2 family fimbrial subunit [Bacteroidales bacterium]